ncbi:magnesium transporter [Methyloceanibacter superfactus]|jgi:magnesium transporter|uniref:Magnesium transporter MgtE n=1 Tax=Methyloceanibacter superfactus TaxID=1774969 RepID=A0A1E3VSG3_9HYPH|nr:magnesium transporter [Methyloceanibacter superfactus]ODR96452.1 magnesium transporter [Methyloceanibacter superfactus]
MQDAASEVQLRDEDGDIRSDFLHAVSTALEEGDAPRARALTLDLHEADLADLIQVLRPEERAGLIATLGEDFKAAALPELDEAVRDQVLEDMPPEQVAEALQQLDSDEAVYLLEDLDKEDQTDILAKLPYFERIALQRSLEYPEDSAGRIMQTDLIAVPPFWSVGQTIDYMRVAQDLPDRFYEIFVVDPAYHLIGSVALNRLLRSRRPTTIESITREDIRPIPVDSDQEEVARQFERYNLTSAPVVDQDKRLVGVITADDVVEVVQEEASEDILRMGGVAGESVSDTVWETTRLRFTWLAANLVTAILASYVISLFEATIEQMVALAVLMPIVASMGGNAGTQTMTVAVRALATQDLGPVNAVRIIMRESAVGLLNGILFALIMAAIAYFWFGSDTLGLVIGVAMVVNLFAAALAGILIPLGLEELDLDPAIASGVFVTTVTDVVGFFAFLGLAALWLV